MLEYVAVLQDASMGWAEKQMFQVFVLFFFLPGLLTKPLP